MENPLRAGRTVAALIIVQMAGSYVAMLTLSQAYAKASVADREHFQFLRVAVASARNWAHFTQLILSGCTMFVLYVALYRFSFVPRPIPALGVIAVALQVTSVAMPYFGQSVVFPMLAPLGLTQLALALWLMVKGFRIFPASATSPSLARNRVS